MVAEAGPAISWKAGVSKGMIDNRNNARNFGEPSQVIVGRSRMNSKKSSEIGMSECSVSQPEIGQQSRRPLRQTLTKQGAKGMAAAIKRLGILMKLLRRDHVKSHSGEAG